MRIDRKQIGKDDEVLDREAHVSLSWKSSDLGRSRQGGL